MPILALYKLSQINKWQCNILKFVLHRRSLTAHLKYVYLLYIFLFVSANFYNFVHLIIEQNDKLARTKKNETSINQVKAYPTCTGNFKYWTSSETLNHWKKQYEATLYT